MHLLLTAWCGRCSKSISILQMREARLKRWAIAQVHSASKWDSWDSHAGHLVPDLMLWIHYEILLLQMSFKAFPYQARTSLYNIKTLHPTTRPYSWRPMHTSTYAQHAYPHNEHLNCILQSQRTFCYCLDISLLPTPLAIVHLSLWVWNVIGFLWTLSS